ncbi:MAG: ATP-binding protein [Patescibacteria group bacterium]
MKTMKHFSVFSQFVLLGIVIFLAIGIFLSMLVGPLLTSFVLKQQELNSSVFFNRLAAELLLPEDFVQPAVGESKARFERFVDNLQFPGLFRIKIWNPRGTIVYSDEEQLIGRVFPLTDDLKNALALKSEIGIVSFDPNDPQTLYEKKFKEGIAFYTPLTFGGEVKPVGVVEVYGRSGFLIQQIDKVRNDFIVRIALSLVFMFITLSFIVWRASETIRLRTKNLEAALFDAQAAARAKSEFLSTMSHELRTPLNSIIGFVKILLMGLTGELQPEQKKQLRVVEQSGEHLLNLVNDVLDLSRIEAGKSELVSKTFDIGDVIGDIISSHTPQAAVKGIALSKTDACHQEIVTDHQRFKVILLNLINNAVKFTKQGSVNVQCHVLDDKISISVVDTGIGIKEEDFGKLFKPFGQADMGITREFGGTGLGLVIVKKNIELMGGTVEFSSESGKGSTFTIFLPKVPPQNRSKS